MIAVIRKYCLKSQTPADEYYWRTGGCQMAGRNACQQALSLDVTNLLRQQGDQIAALAEQVADLQRRLAESSMNQVCY